MRFWISWYEPAVDCRPVTFPPNAAILGWWCTGERCYDEASILVAVVEGEDEDAAKAAVRLDWPGVEHKDKEWRSCEEWDGYLSDRFPPREWMIRRLKGKTE